MARMSTVLQYVRVFHRVVAPARLVKSSSYVRELHDSALAFCILG